MNLVACKKIIFVIVEGPSDELALGVLLTRIFSSKTLYIHVVRGDITTKPGNNLSNIIKKVYDEIKGYADYHKYKQVHFQEIIHIVDTDGIYISDDLIIENTDLLDHIYSGDKIETPSKRNIEQRNLQKRENLNKLSTVGEIWKLPYSIYYMSCNFDHVLYNKMNSDNREKENDSYQFAKRYKDDLQGFLDYIIKSDFAVKFDYKESWEFIKSDNNSLKRNCNLGLVFQDDTLRSR